jgi:hypothetical protein
VRLSADINWSDYSSTSKMRKHLIRFACSEKSNLKRIFENQVPSSDQVEISVKCGKVAKRSFFVFLKCSRNKSRIIGTCSSNKLVDMIDDFSFLEGQMNQSNLTYTLSNPKIFLNSNKIFNNGDKRGLSIKTVLVDLFGTIGFISGATVYIIFGEYNLISMTAFVFGVIFWLGAIIFGSLKRTKYVLIEQE